MSQQTVNFGGAALAEPPAPILPPGDHEGSGTENRRNLMIVGAIVGVLVLGIVAFFLLKAGGSPSKSGDGFVAPHHPARPAVAAAPAPVTLPKHVAAPVGRDPFKALYVAPAAAPSAAPGSTTTTTASSSTSSTSTSTSSGSGSTSTSTTATYHPVWVELHSITSTTATFDVGYSNGKTLRAVRYSGVKAPAPGSRTTFAGSFALLSIRSGSAVVQYGDGTPVRLDTTHDFMVVD